MLGIGNEQSQKSNVGLAAGVVAYKEKRKQARRYMKASNKAGKQRFKFQ